MINNLLFPHKRSSKRLTFKVFFLLITSILLTASSCKKEEPDDPIPNPTYFDDMSATINGQAWKASCTPSWPGLGCTKVHCQYYDDTKSFEISAKNHIYLVRFHKASGKGGIELGQNILDKQISNLTTISIQNCLSEKYLAYKLDTTFINILEIIKIDKSTKIIEGGFNLRVVNSECNDTILIENGYFKTQYWP